MPETGNLAVIAYELNSVALKMAAEAETLARRGIAPDRTESEATQPMLVEEMRDLIRHLNEGTRALRFARLSGHNLKSR